MCWTDRARSLLVVAGLLSAAAGLSGCAEPAGESDLVPLYGESLRANMARQADRTATLGGTGGPLARDFAAAAEPTVTFAFDDASLEAPARAILDGQAAWLLAHPGVPMTIIGHADLVGPERYNYGLGLRRARSARDYLVARGVSPDRLAAVESLGEQRPVVPTADRERRNRRAVTHVGTRVGAGSTAAGGGLDGVYAGRLYNAYQAGRIGASEAEPVTVN